MDKKKMYELVKTLALMGAMGAGATGLLSGCCSHGHGYIDYVPVRVFDCRPCNPGQARPLDQKWKKPKYILLDPRCYHR